MAIAGLPPLNGFVSEWTTLQSLLRVPAYGGVHEGTAAALALALLASTAAHAVLCFVKVVGLALLGSPRRDAVAHAEESPVSLRVGLLVLAGGCVFLGLAPGLLFGALAGVAPWSSAQPTAIGLDLPGTGGLPTLAIAAALVGLVGAAALVRRSPSAAPAPTWACGQLVEPQLAWTSAGFTKPLRLVLESVLRPERELETITRAGVVQEARYAGRVPHLFEERLYRPATRLALQGARHARRLQSGKLGTYVAYLVALVLGLLLAAKVGVIG
jgi:hydrogenase-4 component B